MTTAEVLRLEVAVEVLAQVLLSAITLEAEIQGWVHLRRKMRCLIRGHRLLHCNAPFDLILWLHPVLPRLDTQKVRTLNTCIRAMTHCGTRSPLLELTSLLTWAPTQARQMKRCLFGSLPRKKTRL